MPHPSTTPFFDSAVFLGGLLAFFGFFGVLMAVMKLVCIAVGLVYLFFLEKRRTRACCHVILTGGLFEWKRPWEAHPRRGEVWPLKRVFKGKYLDPPRT